jgi:hypothetical protein
MEVGSGNLDAWYMNPAFRVYQVEFYWMSGSKSIKNRSRFVLFSWAIPSPSAPTWIRSTKISHLAPNSSNWWNNWRGALLNPTFVELKKKIMHHATRYIRNQFVSFSFILFPRRTSTSCYHLIGMRVDEDQKQELATHF